MAPMTSSPAITASSHLGAPNGLISQRQESSIPRVRRVEGVLQDFYTHLRYKDRQFAKLSTESGEDFVLTGLLTTSEGSSSAQDLRNLVGHPVALMVEDQPDASRFYPVVPQATSAGKG
jgi:hypothetical protein